MSGDTTPEAPTATYTTDWLVTSPEDDQRFDTREEALDAARDWVAEDRAQAELDGEWPDTTGAIAVYECREIATAQPRAQPEGTTTYELLVAALIPEVLTHRVESCCDPAKYHTPNTDACVAYTMWRETEARWGPTSPAALGCLLALVREAYDSPAAHVMPHGNGPNFEGFICWDPMRFDHAGRLGEGDTEAEALLASLEAGQ